MTTVNDVVNEAFRKAGLLGIGQTMDGGDIVSGLADFNDMVSAMVHTAMDDMGLA